MLETPHVIAAAAIAVKVGNPYLALPLALVSHFVLDKVPHWNPHLNTDIKKYGKVSKKNFRFVLADSSIALVLGIVISLYSMPDVSKVLIVLLASFMGVLPDLVEAPHYFLNKRNPMITKFIKWQKSIQTDTTPFWGLLTQGLVIIASLLWIVS